MILNRDLSTTAIVKVQVTQACSYYHTRLFADRKPIVKRVYYLRAFSSGIRVSFIVEHCLVKINAIPPMANDFIRLYLTTNIYVHLTTQSIAIIVLVILSWMSVDSCYSVLFLASHCRLRFHNISCWGYNTFIYASLFVYYTCRDFYAWTNLQHWI